MGQPTWVFRLLIRLPVVRTLMMMFMYWHSQRALNREAQADFVQFRRRISGGES